MLRMSWHNLAEAEMAEKAKLLEWDESYLFALVGDILLFIS